MTRVLLLVPTASYRAADFQLAAASLGARVVIGTDRELAISRFGDEGCLVVDLDRPEEAAAVIERYHERFPLDAVVGVDEQGVLAASVAAAKLGLRGNDPSSVARTRDKAAMRAALEAGGVPQPPFRVLEPAADVAQLGDEVGWPCVIKPLSASASRGVIRADDAEEAQGAVARIRNILARTAGGPAAPLLVERYMPGAEVAVEGLLVAGELHVLAIFDKPDPMEGPFFEETLLVTPSRHDASTLADVEKVTAKAAHALGLTEGPIHAELRVDRGHAGLLELAARSIGGLCSRALRFGVDTTLEELILRHALGLPPTNDTRERRAAGVMMIPVPGAGRLKDVRGRDQALAIPGVDSVQITIGPTRPVHPLPEGDRYLGFIFAHAESPHDVEEALRAAHDRLEIEIG
jgi:biotin carboxylase